MSDPTDPQAEALDPATPPARLAALMEHHPDAVLANPAWPLLLTAEPDFWQRLSGRAVLELARSPSCPEALATWLLARATAEAVLNRLAANVVLPAPTRRRALLAIAQPMHGFAIEAAAGLLTADEQALLRKSLLQAPLTLADFERIAALGPRGQAMALAHRDCPGALVVRLEPALPLLAAAHPRLPLERLEALLRSPDADVRGAATHNPSLTPALFAQAAADPLTRAAVAAHVGLPAEWVDAFLRDPDPAVRATLASNTALPETAQRVLALDPSREVRAALLDNPCADPDVRQLAQRTNRQQTALERAQAK